MRAQILFHGSSVETEIWTIAQILLIFTNSNSELNN